MTGQSNNALQAKRPASPKRTILIDGDVLCYRIGLTAEQIVNWASEPGEPETLSIWADVDETKARFKSAIYALKDKHNADWAIIAVTKDAQNFRKALLPTYKDNRTTARKPIILATLRQFCIEHFGALSHPKLEADDILGVLATGGKFGDEDGAELGQVVVVSDDKDLKCIPAQLANFNGEWVYKPCSQLGQALVADAANVFHAIQSIAGDITDHYAGCPGVGMERAKRAVNGGLAWHSYEHVFKSGKRKGQTETRWEQRHSSDLWEILVSHYLKAGLTEEDALVQARCAWILRAENWDNEKQEVRLWEPPNMKLT